MSYSHQIRVCSFLEVQDIGVATFGIRTIEANVYLVLDSTALGDTSFTKLVMASLIFGLALPDGEVLVGLTELKPLKCDR